VPTGRNATAGSATRSAPASRPSRVTDRPQAHTRIVADGRVAVGRWGETGRKSPNPGRRGPRLVRMLRRVSRVTLVGAVLAAVAAVPAGALTSAAAASAGPALSVDAAAGRHAISSDVYGMNFSDAALATELGLTADRWGGNSTSRYNYTNNTHNTGSDYYFENIVDSTLLDSFVAADLAHGD